VVMGAFKLRLEGCRIADARVPFGGMAATPAARKAAETALVGADLADRSAAAVACKKPASDFAPIADQHASAPYRMHVAGISCGKALIEIGGSAPSTAWRAAGRRRSMRQRPRNRSCMP